MTTEIEDIEVMYSIRHGLKTYVPKQQNCSVLISTQYIKINNNKNWVTDFFKKVKAHWSWAVVFPIVISPKFHEAEKDKNLATVNLFYKRNDTAVIYFNNSITIKEMKCKYIKGAYLEIVFLNLKETEFEIIQNWLEANTESLN